jgi:NTE family protein
LTPEPWEGRLLADGGIVNPLPVDVARRLGADLVIAVSVLGLPENPATPIRDDERLAAQWLPRNFTHRTHRNAAPAHRVLELAQLSERLSSGDNDLGLLEILTRATGLAQTRIAASLLRAHPPDCLIAVPLPHMGLVDFHRSTEAVAAGRAAAVLALPAIERALAASTSFKGRVTRWMNYEEPWPRWQAEDSPTPPRLQKGSGSSASV